MSTLLGINWILLSIYVWCHFFTGPNVSAHEEAMLRLICAITATGIAVVMVASDGMFVGGFWAVIAASDFYRWWNSDDTKKRRRRLRQWVSERVRAQLRLPAEGHR